MKKTSLALFLLGALIISSCAGSKPRRPAKMKRSNWRRSKQALYIPVQTQKSNTCYFNA